MGLVQPAIFTVNILNSIQLPENPITINNDSDVFPIEIGIYQNKVFYTEAYRTIFG